MSLIYLANPMRALFYTRFKTCWRKYRSEAHFSNEAALLDLNLVSVIRHV